MSALDEGIAREMADLSERFLAERVGPARLRQSESWRAEEFHALWGGAAELGWFGILAPEERGGLGAGPVEVVALFRAIGRHLFPGPVLEHVVVAPIVAGVADADVRVRLDAAIDGRRWLSVAAEPTGDDWSGRAPWDGVEERGGTLVGSKADIRGGAMVDDLVVTARCGGEPAVYLVEASAPGVEILESDSIDVCSRPAVARFDGAPAERIAAGAEAQLLWDRVTGLARLAVAGELDGIVERATTMSVEYAKTRQQFDRPIGSFQAVKHMLADLWLDGYSLDSVCEYCAVTARDDADAPRAGAVAKAFSALAGRRALHTALQVHGGIGVTEEYDFQLFFKRMLALEGSWGERRDIEAELGRQKLAEARAGQASGRALAMAATAI